MGADGYVSMVDRHGCFASAEAAQQRVDELNAARVARYRGVAIKVVRRRFPQELKAWFEAVEWAESLHSAGVVFRSVDELGECPDEALMVQQELVAMLADHHGLSTVCEVELHGH